jgi:hypothetical protein
MPAQSGNEGCAGTRDPQRAETEHASVRLLASPPLTIRSRWNSAGLVLMASADGGQARAPYTRAPPQRDPSRGGAWPKHTPRALRSAVCRVMPGQFTLGQLRQVQARPLSTSLILTLAHMARGLPTIGARAARTRWTCSGHTPASLAALRFIRYDSGEASSATRVTTRSSCAAWTPSHAGPQPSARPAPVAARAWVRGLGVRLAARPAARLAQSLLRPVAIGSRVRRQA